MKAAAKAAKAAALAASVNPSLTPFTTYSAVSTAYFARSEKLSKQLSRTVFLDLLSHMYRQVLVTLVYLTTCKLTTSI